MVRTGDSSHWVFLGLMIGVISLSDDRIGQMLVFVNGGQCIDLSTDLGPNRRLFVTQFKKCGPRTDRCLDQRHFMNAEPGLT